MVALGVGPPHGFSGGDDGSGPHPHPTLVQ